MGSDFCIQLGGPSFDWPEAFVRIEGLLAGAGFRRQEPIRRLRTSTDGGGFEIVETGELPEPLEVATIGHSDWLERELKAWEGGLTQFDRSDFAFRVGLAVVERRWGTCYFSIPLKKLIQLLHLDDVHRLYSLALLISETLEAEVGVGDVDREFEKSSPADLARAIWDNPANPGFPSCLGIVALSSEFEAEIRKRVARDFVLSDRSGRFLLLEERDYLEVFPKLQV